MYVDFPYYTNIVIFLKNSIIPNNKENVKKSTRNKNELKNMRVNINNNYIIQYNNSKYIQFNRINVNRIKNSEENNNIVDDGREMKKKMEIVMKMKKD